MPTVPAIVRAGAGQNRQIRPLNPYADVETPPTPQEREKIIRAAQGREQGPSLQTQSASFVNWKQLANTLGQPFDAERIPISKLRQMRRDPMIGFGLHYIKTPLVRAPWRINAVDENGPNAQVAAFVDQALRPIYARLIFQYTNSLEFGFSALAKRFRVTQPIGTFVDPNNPNGQEQPVWSEGSVDAVMFKPFVALEPEKVEPVWKDKTGEFDGINFESGTGEGATGAKASAAGKGGKKKANIDVYHALWITNERDSVFGSLFGYPRIAYAYRYWWSYWFRWAHADRYFERLAVPPIVIYYPSGTYTDSDSNEDYDNADVAMESAEAIRSGGIVGLRSDVVENTDGQRSNMREWELKFLEGGDMKTDLYKEFAYLEVMKLRSLWVPEQAFIEGEGGSSSRNVASQMAEIFIQSQSNLMAEIDDHINRYILPQLITLNFPEFTGTCEKITTGFAQEDVDFLKQIIQLVGQDDPYELGVDIPSAMARLGLPTLSAQQRTEQRARLQAESAATNPAIAPPGQSQVGIVQDPTQGTLFDDPIYIQPREQIRLSDDEDFISSLPKSGHYEDKHVKALAARMRKLWKTYYAGQYKDFQEHIAALSKDGGLVVALADKDGNLPGPTLNGEQFNLADDDEPETARSLAEKIVGAWKIPAKAGAAMLKLTADTIKKTMIRASVLEAKKIGVSKPEIDDDDANERAEFVMESTRDTVRGQLVDFLADEIAAGRNVGNIVERFQEHFEDYPTWQSSRVARAEVQDAYNAATLLTAKAAGLGKVQAADASEGTDTTTDKDCINRNGKLFEVDNAIKVKPDHPHCTLFWRPVPEANLSIQYDSEQAELATYDDEDSTIKLSDDISDDDATEYVLAVVDKLRKDANYV